MKQFFAWIKLVGVLVALVGGYLTYYVWALATGQNLPDLLSPKLLGYPILDCLVTGVGIFFGVLAFVYAIAEQRSWKNVLFGLPLFSINAIMLIAWWSMELGHTDVIVGEIFMTIGMVANICAAGIYLFRRFELPVIHTS